VGLAVYNKEQVRIGMVKDGKFIENVNFKPDTEDEITADIAVDEYNREQKNISPAEKEKEEIDSPSTKAVHKQEEVEIKEGRFERDQDDTA